MNLSHILRRIFSMEHTLCLSIDLQKDSTETLEKAREAVSDYLALIQHELSIRKMIEHKHN